jgi:hypothetical protein
MTDIRYDIPVEVHHKDETLPGRLTVSRRVDGTWWDGKVYVHPKLYMDMDQIATSRNGGFAHHSHESFLHHVRLVFGFTGGCRFDFLTDDFWPVPTEFEIDLETIQRRFL